MDSVLEKNLITTKDAKEISGYNPDYLARLARSGKIKGRRVGHSWLIDQESLVEFVKTQGNRKIDYARALAREREEAYAHYRKTNQEITRTLPSSPVLTKTAERVRSLARELTREAPILEEELFDLSKIPARSPAFAISAAMFVVGFAVFAQTYVPIIAQSAGTLALDASSAVRSELSDFVHSADANLAVAAGAMEEQASERLSFQTSALKPLELSLPQIPPAAIGSGASYVSVDSVPHAHFSSFAFNTAAIKQFGMELAGIVTHPLEAHKALGDIAYKTVERAFTAYRALIDASGSSALALGASSRDLLARAPEAISRINLALGSTVIDLAHAAIHADTSLAYLTADAAPKTARISALYLGTIGDTLARGTATVPRVATTAFLKTTAIPAVAGPAIAAAAFGLEYRAALAFNRVTTAFAEQTTRLALNTAGAASWAIYAHLPELASIGSIPDTLQDAYLGALGKSAQALSTFAANTAPQLSAVISASLPALSVGQRAALATYNTIQNLINATSEALAYLIGAPPTVVMPRVPQKNFAVTPAPIATTTVAIQPKAPAYQVPVYTPTSPTYNTIVQGVSQAFVNQSLAALRDNILATVAGMITPVASQTTTNVTTVQQVNMIQDLSNLTVRNGTFKGGTFDSGNLTNGISVTANTGTFNSLNATTTTLGTVTITGPTSVAGALTALTSASAPYFNATSTTATSTFSGGFLAATGGGNVGIATTSPASKFYVEGTALTGPQGVYTPGGAATFEYGSSTVNSTSGFTDYALDKPIVTIRTPNGLIGQNTGVNTALLVEGEPWVRGQSTGIAIELGRTGGYSSRIVHFGDNLNNRGSRLQLQTHLDNSNSIWNPGLKLWEQGQTTIGYGLDGLSPPNSSLFSLYATSTAGGTGTVSSVFEAFGTDSVSSLLKLTNAGLFGIGSTTPWAQLSVNPNALGGGAPEFAVGSSTATHFIVTGAGKVGLGTTSPSQLFSVAGNGYFTGGFGVGITTTTPGVIQTTGDVQVGGNLFVNGNSTTIGQSSSNSLIVNSSVQSNLIPNQNVTYDLGSTSFYWKNAYVGTLTANNISAASTTIGGTQSKTFTLDSANATADTDTQSIIFFRGTVVPNAIFSWNAAGNAKRFELNQPLYINNASASTTLPTLTLQSVGGQTADTFDIASSSGSNMLVVTNTGALGLGTTSPAGTLAVAISSTTPALYVGAAGSSTPSLYVGPANSNGNVGIGTSSPSSQLAIQSNLSSGTNLEIVNTTAGSLGSGIILRKPNSNSFNTIGFYIDTARQYFISHLTDNSLRITRDSAALGGNTNDFVLSTNGNIGIASTTPWGLLSVNPSGIGGGVPEFVVGSSTATHLVVTGAGNVGIGTVSPADKFEVSDTSGNIVARFGNSGGVASVEILGAANSADDINFGTVALPARGKIRYTNNTNATPDALIFQTNSSERMRIDSSGNIGIGTTTPQARTEIAGTGVGLRISASAPQVDFYSTGSVYKATVGVSTGGTIITGSPADALAFRGTPLIFGTQDAVERMRIDSSGNVGIGTTSPNLNNGVTNLTVGSSASGGYINIDSDAASQSQLRFYKNSSLKWATYVPANSTDLRFFDTADEVTFKAGGNVGIGTTSPSSPLSVQNTAGGLVFMATGKFNSYFQMKDYNLNYDAGGLGHANSAGLTLQTNSLTNSPDLTFIDASSSSRVYLSDTGVTNDTGNLYVDISGWNVAKFHKGDNRQGNLILSSNSGDNTYNNASLLVRNRWDGAPAAVLAKLDSTATGDLLDITDENLNNYVSVLSSGRTGFGSSTPWGLLSVNPNALGGGVPEFVVGSSTTTHLVVTGAGNVGIGTTSPTATLTINTGSTAQALYLSGAANQNVRPYVTFSDPNQGSGWNVGMGLGALGGNSFGIVNTTSGNNAVNIDDSPRNNALTIRSTNAPGTVGIGTTTPWGQLSVTGLGAGSGITFATADSGNTPRFVVQDNGNVGIGTTTPQTLLQLNATQGVDMITIGGGVSNVGALGMDSGNFDPYVKAFSNRGFGIRSNGSSFNNFVVASNGNSGAGTSTPWGQLSASTTSTTAPALAIEQKSTGPAAVFQGGNVGIGTTSPYAQLSISNTTGFDAIVVKGSQVNTQMNFTNSNGRVAKFGIIPASDGSNVAAIQSTVDAIELQSSTGASLARMTNAGSFGVGTTSPWGQLSASSTSASPTLAVEQKGTGPAAVFTGGNIGIGTTSPFTKLGIGTNAAGTGGDFYVDTSASAGKIQLSSQSIAAQIQTNVSAVGSLPAGAAFGSLTNAVNFGFLGASAGGKVNINFSTNGSDTGLHISHNWTELMTVLSSGNVGIGTTTPNWNLQVAGTRPSLALSDTSATANLKHWLLSSMGGNLYVGTSTDAYATSTPAALTITNAGSVGIGTASPGAKLDVQGGSASFNGFVISGTLANGAGNPTIQGTGAGTFGIQIIPTTNQGIVAFSAQYEGGNTYRDSRVTMPATGIIAHRFVTNANWTTPTDVIFSVENLATPRLTIQAGGNVGIGSTTPWGQLSVNPNALGGGVPEFVVGSSTTTHLVVTGAGNVGIGSTSPSNKLVVASGNIRVQNGGSTGVPQDQILFDFSGGGFTNSISTEHGGPSSQNKLHLNAYNGLSTVTVLSVVGNSNVGVGSTTPYARLSISSTLSGTTPLFSVASSTNGAATSTAFQIDPFGNIGIGTTSPMSALALGSGQLTVPLGSASAPSIIFSNATNSGFYQDGTVADGVFAAAGGSTVFNFRAGGNYSYASILASSDNTFNIGSGGSRFASIFSTKFLSSLGTASAPSYGFDTGNGNGSNTGIFFTGTFTSGTVDVTTSGTERLTVASGGNVGVGTTTPWGQLSVNPNALGGGVPEFVVGSSSATHFVVTGGGNVGIGTTSPSSKLVVSGGASVGADYNIAAPPNGLIVEGNVGIGTNNPQTKLDFGTSVTNQGQIINIYTNGNNRGGIGMDSTSAAPRIYGSDVNNLAVAFGTISSADGTTFSEKMRIMSSGNVGIGTTTPWGLLSVNPNALGGGVPEFVVGSSTSTHLVVTGAGNVGIGTTTPTATLHVYNGSFTVGTQPLGSPLSYGFQVLNNSNTFTETFLHNQSAQLGIYTNPQSIAETGALGIAYPGNSSGIIAGNNGGNSLVFGTNKTERLRIDASTGNVGIGTTSPQDLLSVQSTGNTGLIITANNAANVSAIAKFRRNTTGATREWWIGTGALANDNFDIYDNTASAARLSINSSGNVGIGTTTPYGMINTGATKVFDVNGTFTQSVIHAGPQELALGGNNGGGMFIDVAGASTASNNFLAFRTQPSASTYGVGITEAMRITSSGNVGIGTTSPSSKLAVSGGASVGADYNIAAPTNGLIVEGNTGIGSTSPFYQLSVHTTNSTGNFLGLSSVSSGLTLNNFSVIATPHTVATIGENNNGFSYNATLNLNSSNQSILNINPSAGTANQATISKSGINGLKILSLGTDVSETRNWIEMETASYLDFKTGATIGVEGTGISRIRATKAGLVGVGSTSPFAKLSVMGNANDTTIATTLFAVGSSTASATTTHFVITNTGNVGIATTSPSGKLSITGSGTALGRAFIVANSNNLDTFIIADNGTATSTGKIISLGSANGFRTDIGTGRYLEFRTSSANADPSTIAVSADSNDNTLSALTINGFATGNESATLPASKSVLEVASGNSAVFAIKSGGNVGIGTTTPDRNLSIFSATSPSLEFSLGAGTGNQWTAGIDTADGNKFKIASSSAVGTNTRLTINGNGNVGIATANPSYLLDVAGVNNGSVTPLRISGSDSSQGLVAKFARSAGSEKSGYLGAAGLDYFYLSSEGALKFRTGVTADSPYNTGVDAAYISAAGNFGIGTTTPQAQLHTTGTARFGNPSDTTGASYFQVSGVASDGRMKLVGADSNGTATIIGSRGAFGGVGCMAFGPAAVSPGGVVSSAGVVGACGGLTEGNITMNGGQMTLAGFTVGGPVGGGTHESLFVQTPSSQPISQIGGATASTTDIGTFSEIGGAFSGTRPKIRFTAMEHIFRVDTGTGSGNPGTTVFTIASTSRVSVGASTTPWALLSVDANALGGGVPEFVVGSSTKTHFLIDGGGNVGIGTANPTAPLHVVSGSSNVLLGLGTNQTISSSFAADERFGVTTNSSASWGQGVSAGGLRVGVSGSFGYVTSAASGNGLLLNPSSGNVGIGTTTPTHLLEVGNGLASEIQTGGYNGVFINPNVITTQLTLASNNNVQGGFITSGSVFYGGSWSNSDFSIRTGNADKVRITSGGNVGIGTTTPNWLLQVAGTRPLRVLSDTSAGANAKHWFEASEGGNFYVGTSSDAFATTTYMTILNGGNVGIGTTSPSATFAVNSSSGNQLFIGTPSATTLVIDSLGRTSLGGGPQGTGNKLDVIGDLGVRTGGQVKFYNPANTGVAVMFFDSSQNITIQNGNSGNFVGNINGGYDFKTFDSGTGLYSDKMTMLQTGNVGIGSTSPYAKLSVQANANDQVINTTLFAVGSSTASATTTLFVVTNAGNVGIGTSSPATLLEVGGSTNNITFDGYKSCTGFTSNANGLVACTASDLRLKTNITPLDSNSSLAAIDALNPVSFYWRPETERGTSQQYGLIAQDVKNVFPNLVQTTNPTALTPDGTLAVNYEGLISPMILAIQTLDARTKSVSNNATSTVMTISANGNVGIGTTTPSHTLSVNGDVGAIAFVNTSTRALKTDISYVDASTTENMLTELKQLKLATYRYTVEPTTDPLRLGLIAEDTSQVAPEILSPDGKGVDLYKLATFTLAGVQTLAAKVDAQETRITSLEKRVAMLESGAVSSASSIGIPSGAGASSTVIGVLNNLGVLIEKGIAQFNTLVFRQLVASKDASGTSSAASVTVLAGNTVVQVNNSLVLPSTKVFVTFNSPLQGSWYVSDKTAGSFRVILSQAQTTDVSFDYFLVQTEGQLATSTPLTNGQSSVTQTGAVNSGAPITILGDNPLHLSVGGTFIEPGVVVASGAPVKTFVNGVEQVANASTISTASPTTYIITYQSLDTSGSIISATRSVIVGNPDGTVSIPSAPGAATSTPASSDTTPPVVTLNGAAAVQLSIGDTWTDPGATALDNIDGNLTAKINVTGSVNTATAGAYTLTYSATDAAGNTGSVSRVVSVVASSTTVTTASSTPAQ